MNINKKVLIIGLLLVIIPMVAGAIGFFVGKLVIDSEAKNTELEKVTVTGEGNVVGKGEEAYINAWFLAEGESEEDVSKKISENSKLVKDKLNEMNIQPRDIRKEIGLDPDIFPSRQVSYYIFITDANKIDIIRNALSKVPGLSVNKEPSYDLSDYTPLQKEARIMALQNARSQIEKIAEDNNSIINRIVSIKETQKLLPNDVNNLHLQNKYIISNSSEIPVSIIYEITYELKKKRTVDKLLNLL